MASLNDEQHTVQVYEKKIAAFRGARNSKGTEELLQLRLDQSLQVIGDEIE